MKITIDEDSSIDISEDSSKLVLSIKTKKDDKTTVLITAKLNAEHLNKLITSLVSLKPMVE